MLRRQGLPPSCPHPEKWLVPVELPVSLLPRAHRADGIHRHWAVAFYAAATSQWKASKTETISPSLEYRSSSGITIHAEVRGRSKGAVSKRPGTGRAFEPYGSRAPQISSGGQRDSRPLAAGGASFFTPRAAAIPPQDGYLRSVPQAGNAASGRSHTCTRPDSRDPRSRPRGPHAADSAP